MSYRIWAAAALVGLVASALRADPVADEVKKLEGTWVVKAATIGGKDVGADRPERVVFAGNTLMVHTAGGRAVRFTFTLDPAKTPKAMDVVPEDKADGVLVGAAIYELDGDKLKLGIASPRPKGFDKVDGPLVVLKRKK